VLLSINFNGYPANVQQTSSKCIQNTLDVCWTSAGSLLDVCWIM